MINKMIHTCLQKQNINLAKTSKIREIWHDNLIIIYYGVTDSSSPVSILTGVISLTSVNQI